MRSNNNKCYRFETIIKNNNNNKKGFLEEGIDATYIIHLEGNGRLNNIRYQLDYFQPSKTMHILFNKGFKKCKKKPYIDSPPIDLIDAFLYVFQHANKKKYGNILVLEDDFFFNEKIVDPHICKDISSFLSEKKREPFIYLLGSIPYIRGPYSGNHHKLFLSCGMHACIYSKVLRESVLSVDPEKIGDWDIYHNIYNFNHKYTYNEPLCYQLFPFTPNSQVWSKYYFGLGKAIVFIFQLLGLETNVEPGYTSFYIFSLLQYYFWIIILVILILYLFGFLFI